MPVIEESALTVIERPEPLALGRAPDVVLEEARKAAVALKNVIDNKPKKVMFNGEVYLEYEDWLTVGRFYGVTAMVKSTHFVEFGSDDEKVRGFEASAEVLLIATNQVISSAEAMCLNDEQNWAKKPLFQLRSMAQTRACAKAMRNVLAWVVVLAGYKPTPAEEMTEATNGSYVNSPQRKSQPVASNGNGKASKIVTQPQVNRLYAIASRHNVPQADIEQYCDDSYKVKPEKLNMVDYDAVVAWVEAQ
jgi:hypothetical protein